MSQLPWTIVVALCGGVGCGNDSYQACQLEPFASGSRDGHRDPLGAGASEARAGRIGPGALPDVPSGLAVWQPGDFVLANSKIALVIEDVGDSDLYDPWGGRPVGMARVVDGSLVEPTNFGELFLLTGRSTVVTEEVTVLADGSDGGPAIIRTRGKLHPLPFFDAVISAVFEERWLDIDAAIDYQLAPGADYVDITYHYHSPRVFSERQPSVLHAFMYTKRTPIMRLDRGFTDEIGGAQAIAFIDDAATSWAYIPDGMIDSALAVSGFVGGFAPGFEMPACGELSRHHAQIVIGGGGPDGIVEAIARTRGERLRAISGTVTRGGSPVVGIHVHAVDPAGNGYYSRATTDGGGAYTIHVPEAATVRLDVAAVGEPIVSTADSAPNIALPALGTVHVTASEDGAPVPARIQVLPVAGAPLPVVPARYGEPPLPEGRLRVEFATTGTADLALPPGQWEIVVSRGYEYELVRQVVTVVADATVNVDAALDRSVLTSGTQCADFHIHTWRSNDSGDDATRKVAQAVADGLELPVRSEHEFIADFAPEIAALGADRFARGFGSIELTSFEVWGHMGVFPLTADPTRPNHGAPAWQTFPTASDRKRPFTTIAPPAVFDAVRARPEAPVVIINHPRGGANYFTYVGFDPATGLADRTADFDTRFTLVEVFNDSDWIANRNLNVADWFGLLRSGRRVFAVGSSDSHALVNSPVGYPRTCIAVGTDDPAGVTANAVRDQLVAGHATVAGGIFVDARIGAARPGDQVTGAGSPMMVDVTVRAATWIDVDAIDVVIDGQTVDTIPIMAGDRDPNDPTIRFHKLVAIDTLAAGSFVVVAAYGDSPLEPVHPGRKPFGVTNPIFVVP